MYYVASLYWMSVFMKIYFGKSPDMDEDDDKEVTPVRVLRETRGQRRVVKMPSYLKDFKR